MTIKQKQLLLAYLGYYKGEIDGKWGRQSILATEAFQNDYQIGVDGIFGGGTEKKILQVIGSGEKPKVNTADKDTNDKTETGTFWDGIKYFTRDEFKCRCGEYHAPYCNGFPAEPKEKLVRTADRVRGHFGKAMNLTSGLRCKQHNADSDGVSNSRHLDGKAMDFFIEGVSASKILAYVQKQPEIRYAYAVTNSVVHMDIL